MRENCGDQGRARKHPPVTISWEREGRHARREGQRAMEKLQEDPQNYARVAKKKNSKKMFAIEQKMFKMR